MGVVLRPDKASYRPADTIATSANCSYIWDRQWDSTVRTWHASKHWALSWNPDDNALLYWSTHDEWTKLRSEIDAGRPTVLGLISFGGDFAQNHQVVAFGYDNNPKTIHVYDNRVGPNAVRLVVDGKYWLQSSGGPPNSDPARNGRWRGWFVESGYSPRIPVGVTALPDLSDGALLRDPGGEIDVVYGGGRFHIPNMDVFAQMGFDASKVQQVGNGMLGALPSMPRDGTLLRDPSSGEIDIVYGDARFHVPSPDILSTLNATGSYELWAGALDGLPSVPRDGTLLRDSSSGEIDIVFGGRRFHVPNPEALNDVAATGSYELWAGALDHIPESPWPPPV